MAETILRLRSRTPDIATLKPSRAMPNSSLRRKYDATFALWMMFLLGRHAMFGHDPPTYLRSMTATRCPRPAKVHAATVDRVPPPRITRSNSSDWVFLSTWVDMRCSSHVFWRSGEPDSFHEFALVPENELQGQRFLSAAPAGRGDESADEGCADRVSREAVRGRDDFAGAAQVHPPDTSNPSSPLSRKRIKAAWAPSCAESCASRSRPALPSGRSFPGCRDSWKLT